MFVDIERETFDLFYKTPSVKIGYTAGTEKGWWMKKGDRL